MFCSSVIPLDRKYPLGSDCFTPHLLSSRACLKLYVLLIVLVFGLRVPLQTFGFFFRFNRAMILPVSSSRTAQSCLSSLVSLLFYYKLGICTMGGSVGSEWAADLEKTSMVWLLFWCFVDSRRTPRGQMLQQRRPWKSLPQALLLASRAIFSRSPSRPLTVCAQRTGARLCATACSTLKHTRFAGPRV